VVTLLGDAASPIPPNIGQGGNKAIEDAGVLAASLSNCNGNLAAALGLYEKLRVKRAADLLRYARQAVQMENLNSSTARWFRDNMMRLMVGWNGTMPSDWLWSYDCHREVQQAAMD
jgi:salicylate hydroxylase